MSQDKHLMNKMKEADLHNKSLEKVAPTLYSLEKQEPYKAPEGYFQHFPEKMLQKIRQQQSPAPKNIQLRNWIYYAAASLVLLVTVAFFAENKPSETIPYSAPEAETYVLESLKQLDKATLLAYADLVEFSEVELFQQVDEDFVESFSLLSIPRDMKVREALEQSGITESDLETLTSEWYY